MAQRRSGHAPFHFCLTRLPNSQQVGHYEIYSVQTDEENDHALQRHVLGK